VDSAPSSWWGNLFNGRLYRVIMKDIDTETTCDLLSAKPTFYIVIEDRNGNKISVDPFGCRLIAPSFVSPGCTEVSFGGSKRICINLRMDKVCEILEEGKRKADRPYRDIIEQLKSDILLARMRGITKVSLDEIEKSIKA
jgi:hypothetical protein